MKRIVLLSLFAVMILLSIPSLKMGGARFGQLAILGSFFLFFWEDLMRKDVAWRILLFFWIAAVLMILLSLNSTSVKIGESKFFVKYLLIFPAAFYTGFYYIRYIDLRTLIRALEIIVLILCLNALLIDLGVVPEAIKNIIVSYRTAFEGSAKYIEYQGTFAEAGWFAITVETTALFALLMRYDFSIWPQKHRWILALLYGFVFVSLVLSKNKTVWIGLLAIMLFLILYKGMLTLIRTNRYMPEYIRMRDPLIARFSRLNTNRMLLMIVVLILAFFIANTLLPKPIITAEMLAEKMQHERGKAFMIVMDLLGRTHWIGGYGFGFVEAYFTLFPQGVIGLGPGSGMIFNSYLDIWLSVTILGLIFHLLLLWFSSSSRYYVTMAIPILLFVYANFNPSIGDEYYYLFLGMSYGIVTCYKDRGHV